MINKLLERLAEAREVLRRPAVRGALRIAGMAIVFGGAAWAVSTLDLTLQSLSIQYLLINLVFLTPVILALAAITFRITANAIGRQASIGLALRTVAAANVAELLPLPGGAVVRGVALVEAGARIGEATQLVILTALLTLSLTTALSAAALGLLIDADWYALSIVAVAGVVAIVGILPRRVHIGHRLAMVAVRIATLAVTVLRLGVSFATLGMAINWDEAALYAIAPTLGAAVGLVPAGLGVSETIAAALATLISASPATAFLAVAINRALGLVVGAAMVLALSFWKKRL